MKDIPLFTVIGWSNTGKTTLICRLIEHYRNLGLKAAALKRTPEAVGGDDEGTDSWKYGAQGACATGLATPAGGTFHMPGFSWSDDTLRRIFQGADIIICEGLKLPGYPIIQTAGAAENLEELKGEPGEWTALISDQPNLRRQAEESGIPVYSTGEISLIPELILSRQPK